MPRRHNARLRKGGGAHGDEHCIHPSTDAARSSEKVSRPASTLLAISWSRPGSKIGTSPRWHRFGWLSSSRNTRNCASSLTDLVTVCYPLLPHRSLPETPRNSQVILPSFTGEHATANAEKNTSKIIADEVFLPAIPLENGPPSLNLPSCGGAIRRRRG